MAANKRKIQANAQKFLQKGQLDRALKEYQSLVKLDPRDSNSRLKLGDIALRQGDKEAATDAYVKVAEQFMKDGFDAKAVAIYKQVGKIDAERLDIYEPLAELYQRLGLTSEALAALQTAADSYHKEGRKRDALELLRKMATLDPTNTTSRLKIADLLRQADMVTDALAEYDAVAEELGRQGAREELLGVYDRILELEPERTSAITAMAQILVDQGMAERAEPYARKLVEVGPDLPEGHELLARIHTAMGREDAATETYRTLAEVYRRIGDDERATEITQRVFGSELAGQAAELGDGTLGGDLSDLPSDEAAVAPNVDLMEQTLDLSGGVDAAFSADAEQLLAEASVYLRYGKTDRAVATLEGLLATEPDHRPALEKLGEAHAERGDKAKAVEIWSRAAQVARSEDDEAAFETLRARIEGLDAEAAAGMGDDDTAGEVSAAAPEADDVGDADEDLERELELELDDSGEPGDDGNELDDIDLEIDLVDESSEDEHSAGEAESGESEEIDEDDADIELELDVDEELEQTSLPDAPAEAVESGGAEQTIIQYSSADATVFQEAPVDEPETTGSGSSTTPQQIAEDLEEASFYFDQGLLEEAEAIYRRVVEAAPNHPQAMLRLGEIAQQRGDDPGSTGDEAIAVDVDAASDAEAAPEEAADEFDDTLGDELVEWGDDDVELAGSDASDAEEDGDELELDVDLDLADAADDTTSPEISVAPVQLEEEAEEEDTAVGVKPPETQAELGSSVDEDTASSDVPFDDEVEIQLDLNDATQSEEPSPASIEDDAAADEEDELEEEALELESSSAEADEESVESVESAVDGADDVALEISFTEPEASLDEAQEAAAADAPQEGGETPLEAVEAPLEEAVPERAEEPELELEREETAADAAEPEEQQPALEEPVAAAAQEELLEEELGAEADDEEEATFDLAAELSDVFDESDESTASPEDSDAGFEAVFREFKKGVKEQLSESDYEAHYDLGIAYREMGLVDDAVSEFRIALGSGEHKLASLHMLGLCALDQGLPRDGAAHFEQALSLPAIPAEQQAPLRFDLARAFEAAGDIVRARTAYEAVIAADPNHAEAAECLEALAEVGAPAQEVETFESFDDLIAEAEAALAPEEAEPGPAAAAELDDAPDDALDDEPTVAEQNDGEEADADAELAEPE
ncbi:MAG: tetratricopeptide repeat protein, partial [Deltaproteobacteria bacterium]|nr:tetratricopeptide repeat protein [Deltaproteobacteria bacterium]